MLPLAIFPDSLSYVSNGVKGNFHSLHIMERVTGRKLMDGEINYSRPVMLLMLGLHFVF